MAKPWNSIAMSLTRHLSRADSSVSLYMRSRFPLANRLLVVKAQREPMRAATTLLPEKREHEAARYSYSTIGTALDYRLRLYFDVLPPITVADYGMAMTSDPMFRASMRAQAAGSGEVTIEAQDEATPMPVGATRQFSGDLSRMLKRVVPTGRRLDDDDEEELARYCIVLGLWEQFYRAGMGINSPLLTPRPKQNTSEMLALATPEMVADMCQLSRLFFDRCPDLISARSSAVLNPTFKGSRLIGGADADLIVGSCLWDIKTSVKSEFNGAWIYQLLGYVLLDFDDSYKIREVGIYLARQGVRLRWPLAELLSTLTKGSTPPGPPLPIEIQLQILRKEFYALLTLGKYLRALLPSEAARLRCPSL